MNVQYAAYSHVFEDVVATGSYAEAQARAEWEDDRVDVWLMVDDWPVLKRLPSSFDRLTILPDGTEIRTSVLQRREVESAWGPEWFGDDALLLTVDLLRERVTVYDKLGDVELTFWPWETTR